MTAPTPTPRVRLDAAAARYRLTGAQDAYDERQAALAGVIAEHARWVAGVPGSRRANLAGADLAGADFEGANLAGANLAGANLAGADFEGAYLARADFEGANLAGAYLARADFEGAYLARADLAGAYLARADLAGAYLARADFEGAYLARADFEGAYLAGANLAGAYLARADFEGAYLARANLAGANLARANLAGADLARIWQDIDDVLRHAPAEVPALLAALREGRVNGSTYQGECACLVGTLANARGCAYSAIPHLRPAADRPAERWFMAIRRGDTPANSVVCALTVQYVEWWLSPESEVSP